MASLSVSMVFSGSYAPDDVTFLLTPLSLEPTDTNEKERLIQSGNRHYSEMIGREDPPSAAYLSVFNAAFAANRERLARDVVTLARALIARSRPEIVLVSLARAGTPVGVLLRRALRLLGHDAPHYSISIIRDRGIDGVALDYMLQRHNADDVFFIDGWTGKGAIAGELDRSLAIYNAERGTNVPSTLTVLADLAGVATIAATSEDYLIPTAILNAVVSGLVSRTILNDDVIALGSYHGCVIFTHLEPHDLSRWVVDELQTDLEAAVAEPAIEPPVWDDDRRAFLRSISDSFVAGIMQRFGVTDRNRVKPGIGEATRALLRRVPERLIVQDTVGDDLAHLLLLANTRGVPVDVDSSMPYRAAVIIKSLGLDL